MTKNIPSGMKAFDMQEAMKDITRIRTRDGMKVIQAFIADKAQPNSRFVFILKNKNPYSCSEFGDYCIDGVEYNLDIFLLEDEYFVEIKQQNGSQMPHIYSPNIPSSGKYKLVKV